MDLNDIRSWMTVFQMAVFIGIVVWAWGRGRKAQFDEASRLALEDEEFITADRPAAGARGR